MQVKTEKKVKSVQKINNNYKVSLYKDDDTFFKLNEQLIIDYKITVNKDITDIYDKLIYENIYYTFYEKSLKYTLRSLKNSGHIKNYLIKNKCPDEYVEKIIKRLKENKLLDDNLYISMYTKSSLDKGYGKLYIKSKLKSMNFSNEEIDNSFEIIDEALYIKKLKNMVLKKLKMLEAKNKNSKTKIINYLLARGFEYEIINDTLKIMRI